jgi:hypothetical protein
LLSAVGVKEGFMVLESENLEDKEVSGSDESKGFNASVDHLKQLCVLIEDATKYDVNDNPFGYRKNLKHLWMRGKWHLDKEERKKGQEDWKKISCAVCIVDADNERFIVDDGLIQQMDDFFEWLQGRLHKHEVTYSKRALRELGLGYQRKLMGMG